MRNPLLCGWPLCFKEDELINIDWQYYNALFCLAIEEISLMVDKISITMVGTGYVGLVSGACFAELGWSVTCIDKDAQKIKSLQEAEISIYEAGLRELVQSNLEKQRLQFKTDLAEALHSSEVVFIAVGTPTDPDTGQANLHDIEAVAQEIAPYLENHKFIVVKSTVPVGTGKRIKNLILQANPQAKFNMISNPEFLREGSAVSDFMNPDRVIIGSEGEAARKIMDTLYQPLLNRNIPILHTSIETSEMIKYAANCFLATKIAYTNEIADLCEKLSANVEEVMLGVGLDNRIGIGYLKPGPGFGGSCFPKDTRALAHVAQAVHSPLTIIDAVIEANEKRKMDIVDKILAACGGSLNGKKIAILGVAFKANTDDVRESAALAIIQGLQAEGAVVSAFDPVAMKRAAEVLKGVVWAKTSYEASENATAVVIVTEWAEFAELDLARIRINMKLVSDHPPTLIDLRNLYAPEVAAAAGLRYLSSGRPAAEPSFWDNAEAKSVSL